MSPPPTSEQPPAAPPAAPAPPTAAAPAGPAAPAASPSPLLARARFAAVWSAQAAFVLGFLYWAFDLSHHDLRVPLVFRRDAMHHLALARDLLDGGWWWTIERLSAPFGARFDLFPVAGLFDSFLYWVVARFVNDAGTVITGFWFLSFVLTAWSASWSLRLLDVSRSLAWAAGVLYAFLPHAFGREVEHLMLVSYFVPPMSALAMLLLRGRFLELPRAVRGALLVLCLGVGLDYVYTAFFTCYLLLIAGAGAWASGHGRRTALAAFLAIGIVATGTALATAPSLVAWKRDPEAAQRISSKPVAEAELYGLKIRHLLMPIAGHPLESVRKFESLFTAAQFPLENENGIERLGLFGAIGFLVLLGALVVLPNRRTPSGPLAAPATLNIAAVALATIGGLGAIFNTLVAADVRCYNRIGVFIAFFAVFTTAHLLDRALAFLTTPSQLRFVAPVLALVLAVLGAFDQVDYRAIRRHMVIARGDYAVLAPFVAQLEQRLPAGAMVFQLPPVGYPHTPPYFRMEAHQQMAPFIVSRHLRWSNAALSTEALHFEQQVAGQSPQGLVELLRGRGFRGIWVDGFGYPDGGGGVLQALAQLAPGGVQRSPDGRYAFVDLGGGATAAPPAPPP